MHPSIPRKSPQITAAVALGSNVGDRAAHLRAALDALGVLPSTRVLRASGFVETAPVGPIPQGLFLNAAALVETSLPPRGILDALLTIEHNRGRDRDREQRWGPRTLDLDLLLYGDSIINEPGLTVPHPRLHERLFVLTPLAEIAPDVIVPTLGRTVRELLGALIAADGTAPAPPAKPRTHECGDSSSGR